jgi:hypothetical protein
VKFRLLHTETWNPASIGEALAAEQVDAVMLSEPVANKIDGLPTVFLLDHEGRKRIAPAVLDSLRENGATIVALGGPGEEDVPADLPVDLLSGFVKTPAPPRELLVALRSAYREAAARREAAQARRDIATRTKEVAELAEIGIKLTTE